MIIKQEETNEINDFILNTNTKGVFNNFINLTEETEVDTDELKIFTQGLINLLKKFEKHIESVERETKKKEVTNKFNGLINSGLED